MVQCRKSFDQLMHYDGRKSVRLTKLCSDKNELGAGYYSLEEYENYLDSSRIMGDVNDDGEFNIADLVLFQKWLLAVSDSELANWKAADFFYEDERLDVFDLCLMRQAFIEAENDDGIIRLPRKLINQDTCLSNYQV